MKVKLKHLTIEYRRRPQPWGEVKKHRGKPWCQVSLLGHDGPNGFSETGYLIISEDKKR